METDKIYNLNCMTGFKGIPSESIDLVVTDPPYRICPRGHSILHGTMNDPLSMKGKIFEDNDIDITDWLPELYRVLKDGTHCYVMVNNFNLIHYLKVIDDSDFHFTRLLVWDKKRKINGVRYMGQVEFIIMLSKGTPRKINNCGTSDLLSYPINKLRDKNGEVYHPTEKPVELMEKLISNSSNPGDTVLDPFCGIGSTMIAASRLGRHYLGFEINLRYAIIADTRLNIANQPTLF